MWFLTALFITLLIYVDSSSAAAVLWLSFLLSFLF
jgi:hypothetical protein